MHLQRPIVGRGVAIVVSDISTGSSEPEQALPPSTVGSPQEQRLAGQLNPALEQIYASGQVSTASAEKRSAFPTATRREDAELLADLVAANRPRKTLEIGMAFGLSTVAIADALEADAAPHVVIDPFQSAGWDGIGLHTVALAGLEGRTEFVEEPSQSVLARYAEEGRQFDFVFHDGSHLFDALMTDLYFINRMLPEGGVIVIDDLWMPSVRRAASFLITNLDYRVEPSETGRSTKDRIFKPLARFARDPRPFAPLPITLFSGKIMVLRKASERKRNWDFFRAF